MPERPAKAKTRKDRLAAALRENLRRRKAQGQARKSASDAPEQHAAPPRTDNASK